MTKSLYLLLVFISISATSFAQQGFSVSGTVVDTQNHSSLRYATATLIRAKDSILKDFAHSDSSGTFSLKVDSADIYLIMISYPGFADYLDRVNVVKDVSLGNIPLANNAHVLQEFVFQKRAAAMRINGDTTEYNADSFSVAQGATVEDLLKKLPGLQVDKDGKITAQGETVQKVLVDGEEFFSDDPAVVTQNLQSAVVDKVQVYDKKSDEAAFTGIDDGIKTKTINLLLKENAKRGFFGKVILGGGPSLSKDFKGGFFENQGMINAFKGKRQISAFGIMSNTGTVGLGWQDGNKFGSGSSSFSYNEDEDSWTSAGDADDINGYGANFSGQGLPTAWTGGLHYANKWLKDNKLHLTGNYRYAKNNVDGEATTISQYNLSDSGYVSTQHQNTFSTAQRHAGDAQLEWAVDTSSNLKFNINVGTTNRKSNGNYSTITNTTGDAPINNSQRYSSSESDAQNVNSSLSYRKRFKKTGRSMSAELNESYRTSTGSGLLQSQNNYYTDGHQSSADSINQLKKNSADATSFNATLTYTEPLSKKTFLTFKYGLSTAQNSSDQLSFNKAGGDWNDIPDSEFSSSYDYNQTTHNGNATVRFVFKKYNFSVGGDVYATQWKQHDNFLNTARNRDFTNYSPRVNFKYNFSKQSSLMFNYSGSTRQPSLQQLQPLNQNTDPLNITIGNPSLRQAFRNLVRFNYNSYKVLSGQYIYVGGGASMTNNDIVNTQFISDKGINTTQYVNTNGNWNGYIWAGYSSKYKPLDVKLSVNGNLNLSHNNNFVNGLKNTTDANNYRFGVSMNKDWKKKDKDVYGIHVNPSVTYQDNQSTVSTYTTSYWSASITADAYAELFWKLKIKSDIDWALRETTPIFTTNNNVIRWNASISRKFGKGDQLELRASVEDILNQNLGYNRNASSYTITETRYNTIRRHGLFSLIWNFKNSPATKGAGSDDDDE